MSSSEWNFPKHEEQFEVVMIQDGFHEFNAKPEHLKRVAVTATDPLAAQLSDTVRGMKGWHPLCATKPGVLTHPEIQVRQRAFEVPADPTKL